MSSFQQHQGSHRLLLVWTELEVLPQYRGKGIESQLIQWALSGYGLSREYVWCYARMDEMQTFINHGWQAVGFVDIDLSEVRGKNRGYGIYRLHGMIRKPGPLCV
jgi:GNAT superfamily N-acetyltransferase